MRTYIPKDASLVPEKAKKVFSGEIFSIYQWEQELFDGTSKTFEMAKRADTVEIIAIHEGKVVLTKERQPHIPKAFISLPAGMHDLEGEDELTAAKRELAEETGYTFKNWKLIEARQAGSGKVEHILYTFLATDLEHMKGQKLDAGEEIEVVEMPFSEFINAEGKAEVRFYPASIMHGKNSLEDLLAMPNLYENEN